MTDADFTHAVRLETELASERARADRASLLAVQTQMSLLKVRAQLKAADQLIEELLKLAARAAGLKP